MKAVLRNNSNTQLAQSLDDSATSFDVLNAGNLPQIAADQWFPLTLIRAGTDPEEVEIVHVTDVSSNTLTVNRGQEGSIPLTFDSGDVAAVRLTEESLRALEASGMYVELDGTTMTVDAALQQLDTALGDAEQSLTQKVDTGQVGAEDVTTSTGTQTVTQALDRRGIKFSALRAPASGEFDPEDYLETSTTIQLGAECYTLGYRLPGDGGGNDYKIVAAGTGTDDGGSYIDLTGSGYQAEGLFSKFVSAEQFGHPENSSAIKNSIAFAKSNSSTVLLTGAQINYPSDIETINDAFQYTRLIPYSQSSQIIVNIESGSIITSTFHIVQGDYSKYTLTSEDSTVIADAENVGDTTIFSTSGAFCVVNDCKGPTWDILVDCQNTGPGDIKGITVMGPNATININGGKGLMNLGLRDNISGPEPTQYGYGLLVWNCASARFNNSIIKGCAGRNLWISRSAKVTGAYGDYSGAQGQAGADPQDSANHGAVYCTRASWANLEFSNFDNCANRGITCTRGYVNAESGTFDNMGGPAVTWDRGGRINLYGATGQGGLPLKRSEIGGAGKNFNFLSGDGIGFEGANSPPSVDSFSSEGPDGNYVLLPSGDLTNYRTRANPLTLTFENSAELRATWDFPYSFAGAGEYFIELSLVSETFPSSKRGQWQAKYFSAGTDSVDVVLQSDGLWEAGETADVMVKAIGKAF